MMPVLPFTKENRGTAHLLVREYNLMTELAACRAEVRRLTAVVDVSQREAEYSRARLEAVDAARLRALHALETAALVP